MKTPEKKIKYETGVIHGRFQILHNDHLEYILSGKKLCLHLVIGITNPDPTTVKQEAADSKRSSPLANPLTYYERHVLVRLAMESAGVKPEKYSVVPLPISIPELYKYYVPVDAVFFLSIYDNWGRRKKKIF
jgi:nicotinamide mononucleotide adenylyltransferase